MSFMVSDKGKKEGKKGRESGLEESKTDV